MRYIEWLTTPPQIREPPTEALLAKELDVFPKTLYNWRQDRDFRDVWHDTTDEVIGGDDRRQTVIDSLYEAARDPRNPRHVQAAKLFLETINAISPPKDPSVAQAKAIGMLTDEELEGYIAQGVIEAQAS